MGRIQLSSFNALRVSGSTATVVKNMYPDNKEKIDNACHRKKVEATTPKAIFPILPQRFQGEDLPFIPSAEVIKRDGKGDNRLCTYLQLPKTLAPNESPLPTLGC